MSYTLNGRFTFLGEKAALLLVNEHQTFEFNGKGALEGSPSGQEIPLRGILHAENLAGFFTADSYFESQITESNSIEITFIFRNGMRIPFTGSMEGIIRGQINGEGKWKKLK